LRAVSTDGREECGKLVQAKVRGVDDAPQTLFFELGTQEGELDTVVLLGEQ
jgi:hypothetical protein